VRVGDGHRPRERAGLLDLSGGAHDRSKPLTGLSQPVREMLSALAVVAGRPSAR